MLDFTQGELKKYNDDVDKYAEFSITGDGWFITMLGKRHGVEREVNDYFEYVIETNKNGKWFVRESGIWDPAPQRVDKPFPLPLSIDIYTLLFLYKLKGIQVDAEIILCTILDNIPVYARYFYLKMCVLVKGKNVSADPIPTGSYETEEEVWARLDKMSPNLDKMKEYVLSLI